MAKRSELNPTGFWEKELLKCQINDAPEPLRSYIHGLEVGGLSDVISLNQQLREENQEMKSVLEKQGT